MSRKLGKMLGWALGSGNMKVQWVQYLLVQKLNWQTMYVLENSREMSKFEFVSDIIEM